MLEYIKCRIDQLTAWKLDVDKLILYLSEIQIILKYLNPYLVCQVSKVSQFQVQITILNYG